MGLIHEWSRVAALAPKCANAMLHMPILSSLTKWVGGIAQQRHIPSYAEQTFADWFHRRGRREGGRRVLLWPDTFNNYFRPQTAIAATNVLESLGFTVIVPERPHCCGRPLYDWGMLDSAERLCRHTAARSFEF
jgi:Fe-S oxidoreductase